MKTGTTGRTPADEAGPPDRGVHDALLREQVLASLGEPPCLLLVQVRHLWGPFYRVNVLVGEHIASARAAHSFFLQSGRDGRVLSAEPPITRRY